jgi:hypothetical protein
MSRKLIKTTSGNTISTTRSSKKTVKPRKTINFSRNKLKDRPIMQINNLDSLIKTTKKEASRIMFMASIRVCQEIWTTSRANRANSTKNNMIRT